MNFWQTVLISLVTRMWDKYIAPDWRNIKTRKFDGTDKIDPEVERKIVEKISKFAKEAKPVERSTVGSSDGASLLVEHIASAKRGKWQMFPPEIENSKRRIFD